MTSPGPFPSDLTPPSPVRSRVRSRLAVAAMALVLVYVGVDVILQGLPPHYSVISDAESDLAVGQFGWAMQVNFALRAVMSGCVVAAVALLGPVSAARRSGLVLLSVAGLCSAALVFFPTDVNRPGEYGMTARTTVGLIHVIFATTGFVAVLAAMVVLTASLRLTVPGPRAAVAFLAVGGAGLILLAVSLTVLPQVVGLTERVCLAGILGWAYVLCAGIRRVDPAGPRIGSA